MSSDRAHEPDRTSDRTSGTAAPSARSGGFIGNLRNLGPGLLVAAAFLGPGTITTASTAGADFGSSSCGPWRSACSRPWSCRR